MGEQRKHDMDDVRKSSGSLHSGKQVRDPSDIRVAVYSCTAADYEENHKELHNSVIKNHPHWKITEIYMNKGELKQKCEVVTFKMDAQKTLCWV